MEKQEKTRDEMVMEGNKLIAEFMGWTIEPGMEEDKDPYYNWNKGFSLALLSDLLFHEKWDWLMPVVEKIEDLKIKHPHNTDKRNNTQFKVIIFRTCCDIQNNNDHFGGHIIEVTGKKDKITAIWIAITQFILWLNSQKQ